MNPWKSAVYMMAENFEKVRDCAKEAKLFAKAAAFAEAAVLVRHFAASIERQEQQAKVPS